MWNFADGKINLVSLRQTFFFAWLQYLTTWLIIKYYYLCSFDTILQV